MLSFFNITAEVIKAELYRQSKQELVYFALDQKGSKDGNPFKFSRFDKDAGLEALQKHFNAS